MKNYTNKDKDHLIDYIKKHSAIVYSHQLEKLRLEDLVIMKVQLELDMQNKENTKKYEILGIV